MSNHTYDKISITAKLVAYFRQFSDIAYARDVAEFVHAEDALREIAANLGEVGDDVTMPKEGMIYAPLLEARYKSLVNVIHKVGVQQVLELASGVSLRGLSMTQDADFNYVESDLPGLNEQKRSLVAAVRAKYGLKHAENHHVVDANAMDFAELEAAVAPLDKQHAVAVVVEGLIPYLTSNELHSLASNIHKLLDSFASGSVWITPDFTFKDYEDNIPDRVKRFRRAILGATTRQLHASAFDDVEALNKFFDESGFTSERFNMFDLAGELSSPDALGIGSEIIDRLRARMSVWVIRPVSQPK